MTWKLYCIDLKGLVLKKICNNWSRIQAIIFLLTLSTIINTIHIFFLLHNPAWSMTTFLPWQGKYKTLLLKFKTNFKIVHIDQLNWCQFVTCSILIHPNSPKKYLFSTQSHFVFYRSLQTKSVHSCNLETSAAYFSEGHISTSLSRIKREQVISSSTSSPPDREDELSGASPPSPESSTSPISPPNYPPESPTLTSSSSISGPGPGKGKRGRPRKHAPKLPLPPLYVFIRNMLHNPGYNPSVIAWVDDEAGCFKVSQVINLLLVNFPPQQTELLWNSQLSKMYYISISRAKSVTVCDTGRFIRIRFIVQFF